jgi:hypothetical protein
MPTTTTTTKWSPGDPILPGFSNEELKRDAQTIRAILRKYSPNPESYSGILPLHPAMLPQIIRTRCITAADVIDSMYGRDYIWGGVRAGGDREGVKFLMTDRKGRKMSRSR